MDKHKTLICDAKLLKNILFVLVAAFFSVSAASAEKTIDTLYYDNHWKVVSEPAFASYYRIYSLKAPKMYRDFFITGEAQCDQGEYVYIDKVDDNKSIMPGPFTTYYKSGKVEWKGTRNAQGNYEGLHICYYENGQMQQQTNEVNGKIEGTLIYCSEDGKNCWQKEYKNGVSATDYIIQTTADGYYCKYYADTKKILHDQPKAADMKTEYSHGTAWQYYHANGLIIYASNTAIKDYGKYFQIPIIIVNHSFETVDVDPRSLCATITKKDGKVESMYVLPADEYMEKIEHKRKWNSISAAITGVATSLGGTSSSYTQNSDGSSSYTRTYDPQAQAAIMNQYAARDAAILNDMINADANYLKRTTLKPGERLAGYINIEKDKGTSMTVNFNIAGIIYSFPWNIAK
jgi:hypothetical protein